MPEPCSGGPLEAVFHTFDRWTGMCGCGAGPFVEAEHRQHYLAATASTTGGCIAVDLSARS
jgi:hypothetical protein